MEAISAWAGPRDTEWSFRLLNSRDEDQGELRGVTGGNVEILTLARLGGSAEISLSDVGQEIDFMTDRVQILYDPGIPDLDREQGSMIPPIPWGVWLFSSPLMGHSVIVRNEISLLSKMVIIDEDTFVDAFSVPANSPVTSVVESIIRGTGETRLAVTPSDKVTHNALVWEPGTSKLTIINELLEAIGYQALWCDGSGQFRVNPYLNPSSRPVSWVFPDGDPSIVKPGWSREQDLAGVPNRVVVFSEGTDTEPAISGYDEITDPDNPFSIPRRNGRVITRRVEVPDISSQEEADELATRYLIGGFSPVALLEVTHAIVPLEPGDRVVFTGGDSPVTREATVQRMSMPFSFNAQCDATWREI